MPLYDYIHTSGKRISLLKSVQDRDKMPPCWKRVTVPDRIYSHRKLPNPAHAMQAVHRAFREKELTGDSQRWERFKARTGMSREFVQKTWSEPEPA